ncbi:MAG TPA: cache domain-containing protein, partial [Nitrosospira sp.]|nr:cache domain-containing protein [Nitrosospira sp.]
MSLKWKVLLLSSLILIAIVVSFTGITYRSLMNDFEKQREVQHRRYALEVEGLIQQISNNLHQLAQLIPFLEGMSAALLSSRAALINQIFDSYWAPLQLNNDIELIRFYGSSSMLLASWGVSESYTEESVMRTWVQEANLREQPISPLSCDKSCTQFTVTPLLVEGKHVGVVVIGVPLVDVVLGFKDISGAHIGLLMKEQGSVPGPGNNGAKIENWNFQLTAHSKEMNVEVLQRAAELYPDFDSIKDGVDVFWDNRYLRIKPLALHELIVSEKARLVVITDISSTIRTIQRSTQQSIIIGLVGLILSEILLFIILTKPLSRLKHIVFTLPLLARSSFHDFRSSLRSTTQKQLLKDEIDMLDETAVALSFQLETLEDQVADRTRILARKMDELSKERDFITHLLDIAQVIVITQNAQGEILTLNAHGEMLIQYA